MKDESNISASLANDALRNRDVTVFQELYTTYSEPLYLLAFRWVKDSSLAKDIVHNLFAHLWDRGGDIVITGQVRSYLYRAVTNLCINELKRRKRHIGEEILRFQADDHSFFEISDYILFQQELTQHLGTLAPRCREILLLSRVHGLEPAEIAGKLGISVNTVYFQLSVALKSLRGRLGPKKNS
ncbi:RNA polymerase sigma factor [Chitinophaga rhizosphaerae]|uniref:RNA polymerase sigma factor n=1 Tax=Chitinophaga rhizosphaerae TaxID=1864947 RepID=UPI000F815628|nr:sigma-70 family RNA polymerase sigma factor [Chitinophaga rhizosphaerae]